MTFILRGIPPTFIFHSFIHKVQIYGDVRNKLPFHSSCPFCNFVYEELPYLTSCLGPILFILYINDVFVPDNIISMANNVQWALKDWNSLNCLTVNAAKTKAMLFRARNKEVNRTTDVIFNEANVDFVTEIKNSWRIFHGRYFMELPRKLRASKPK